MGPCEGAEMSQAAGTSFRQFRAMVRSCASAAPSWWPPPSRPPRGLSFSPLGEGFPGAQGPRQRSATAKRRQSGVMRDGRMRGSLTRPSRPLCVASATLAAIAACLPSDCLNPGSVSSPFGVDRQQSLQNRRLAWSQQAERGHSQLASYRTASAIARHSAYMGSTGC